MRFTGKFKEDELDDPACTFPYAIMVERNRAFSGEYIYKDQGAGGIIYLNKNNKFIIKLYFSQDVAENEVKLQLMAGNLAPRIYYNRKVIIDGHQREDRIKEVNNNQPVFIVIMEFLDSPNGWFPLKINDDNATKALLSDRRVSKRLINSVSLN